MATDEFTVADILHAYVLRGIRTMDLMEKYPLLQDYYKRCFSRPAWQRTLELSAKRLEVDINKIR